MTIDEMKKQMAGDDFRFDQNQIDNALEMLYFIGVGQDLAWGKGEGIVTSDISIGNSIDKDLWEYLKQGHIQEFSHRYKVCNLYRLTHDGETIFHELREIRNKTDAEGFKREFLSINPKIFAISSPINRNDRIDSLQIKNDCIILFSNSKKGDKLKSSFYNKKSILDGLLKKYNLYIELTKFDSKHKERSKSKFLNNDEVYQIILEQINNFPERLNNSLSKLNKKVSFYNYLIKSIHNPELREKINNEYPDYFNEFKQIIDKLKGEKITTNFNPSDPRYFKISPNENENFKNKIEKIKQDYIDEVSNPVITYLMDEEIPKPDKQQGHDKTKKPGENDKKDVKEQTETLKSILPETPYEFLITFPPYAKDGVKVFGRNELKGKLAFGYEIEDSGNINYDKLLTIDLFDINQPHFGAFQQVRSGKSTLAGNIILQAAFQGLPVVIFDPKPDYVSNIISIQDTIESRPDHKEGIEPRFKDIRGFDFTTKVPFDYDGKQWNIEFNIYSFDEKLRELPNCNVLKIPLVSLPQRDSQNFDEICDYIATNLADTISSGTKKKARGFNVLISKIIKQFSKEYSDRDVIFFDDFYKILDKLIQDSVEKKDKEKLEKLSEELKVFQTSQSFIFAKNKNETLDMRELIKNPLDIDGDRKTVSISVIDISSLPQAKETPILRNYVSEVCAQIFNIVRKINVQRPVKLLVVFDEAQNYLPRPSDLYNSVRRILTGGASIGIKAWVIAQSPQNIEKEATKQLTTFICANVSQSTIQDDISKYVTDEKWTEKLRHTGLGRVLIFNKDMKPNGKLCLTFTTPQTVDLLTPTEIVDKCKNFFK